MSNNIDLFTIGSKYTVSLTATPELMNQYRQLSGDENPVHHDKNFAIARGFEGPIVYGNLLGAMVSKLIGVALPTPEIVILRQSLDFRKPAYVGQEITLVAEVTALHVAVQSVQFMLAFNSTTTNSFCTGQCLIKCL
ncbi:MAG: MaoC/PaaZ C-terminal domain-containing protein [Bdellovibrionota bacterium]